VGGGGGIHVFTLAGVPVRISIWFFLLLGYYVWRVGVVAGTIFSIAVIISILIHEFGHALVAKAFSLSPEVELHGFGGLTYHQRAQTNRDDVLIIAAGPGAGLVFGAVVYGAYVATRAVAPGLLFDQPHLAMLIDDLLWINIGWSLVNLLPLWPLDGGQLFRLLMIRFLHPGTAERVTHIVGLVLGGGAIVVSRFYFGGGLVFIIALFITIQNAMRIGDTRASGPIRLFNRFARGLLRKAEDAFERRDWEEAARICHQIRQEKNIDAKTLDRVWAILSVASVELGRYEEAWSYVQRARLKGPVVFARAKAIVALEKSSEARELLGHKEIASLPPALKESLEEVAALA
jgi:Zn-dependent protease